MEEELIIPKIFTVTAARFADKVALQIKKNDAWQRFTFREVEAQSLKVAAFLIKEGFKKGDFAVLISENRPEWGIIYLGVIYAGLTCVPIDIQLSRPEIENLTFDCAAKIIFCSYNIFAEKISPEIQSKLSKIVVLDAVDLRLQNLINFSQIQNIQADKTLLPDVSPEDIASLIYTSGTTAKPKGVLLTHKNFCFDFRSIEKINLCFPSDNFLSILPLHHTYAFMITLLMPLFLGGTATYCFSFKPQDLGRIMQEGGASVLVGVPQLFSMLHKAIFEKIKKIPPFLLPLILPLIRKKVRGQLGGKLRLFASGGARLEPKIGRDLSKILGIKVLEGYGLTETAPVVTLNPKERVKFGSVGKVIPGVEIKINNPDKDGIGEVLIKGANVMSGYFKNPDLTSQVIKDGWFYSGDLGYLDNEGYLYLTGREKDVIVLSSGKNIYPEELEEYYSRSPYIKEMCIYARHEESFGRRIESLYAVAVPNLEYFRKMNETDIRGKIRWEFENLAKHLPSYSHIMGFTVTKEDLPRTALKKLKRYQVRQKYLEEKPQKIEIKEMAFSDEDRKAIDEEAARKIIKYVSSQLKKPVSLESHLEIDLGIDSLGRVDLGLGLEALFSVQIPDEMLYSISTIREAAIKISEMLKKGKPEEYAGRIQKNWPEILREEPRKEIRDKIRVRVSFFDAAFTVIFRLTFFLILRTFWLLKVEGKENLPKQGPFIVCPNHASYLDGFAIFSSMPFRYARNIFFIGHSAIFEHPLISWVVKIGRLISIDPNVHLTEAMQAASFVLRQGKIVCIFPEGRRSIGEDLGEFKKGVGILIKELDIPVVPAYIKGSHKSWPRGSRFPRLCGLKIIFARPLSAAELLKGLRREDFSDDYEAVTAGLKREVVKLAC